jgi:hypothetical protein
MCVFGLLAWALNALLWSIGFLGHGLQYSPLKSQTGWLLVTGLLIVFLAGVHDKIRYWKK